MVNIFVYFIFNLFIVHKFIYKYFNPFLFFYDQVYDVLMRSICLIIFLKDLYLILLCRTQLEIIYASHHQVLTVVVENIYLYKSRYLNMTNVQFYYFSLSTIHAVICTFIEERSVGAHAHSVRSAFKIHPSLSFCPSVSGIPNTYSLQLVEKINVYLYTRAHIFIQSKLL